MGLRASFAKYPRAAGLLALIGWSVAGGCAELPEIPEGSCGNDIVDKGEDCDTFAPAGRVCRPSGAAGACRYDCTERKDGSRPSCPDGWACGTDSICRVASGNFAPLGEPIAAAAIRAADFDGDHRADLLLATQSEITVRYYDAEGALGKTVALPGVLLDAIGVGDLTGDGLTDLLLPIGITGVGVLRAQPDRTLVPVVQSSITIGALVPGSRVVPVEALKDNPGVEAFAIYPGPGGKAFFFLPITPDMNPNQPNTTPLFVLTDDPAKIAGDVPVGPLHDDPATPCDDLVLGYQGASQVLVYTPCSSSSDLDYAVKPHVVKLPSGTQVAGRVFIADVNGDSRRDIVISAEAASGLEIDVAYGLGNGTFHSDYQNLPATGPGDDIASPLTPVSGGSMEGSTGTGPPVGSIDDGLPIAVGDLNLDGRADAVSANWIYLSYDPGDGKLAYDSVSAGDGWTSVVIADFNGNDLPDIIGGSRDGTGIDFYNGLGTGVFNPFRISTQGAVDHFVAGDFDGDLIVDLAYAEKSTSGLDDSLSFLFGRSVGAPEEPVSAGRLHEIQQIVGGDRLLEFVYTGGFYTTSDGIADLAALSLSADESNGNLTVVPGSSDRRMQSPYLFLHKKGNDEQPAQPLRSAVGRFTPGDAIGDLAVLAYDLDGTRNVWLIPSDADAKFGTPLLTELPADFAPYASEYLLAAGDLDGPADPDHLDEVVVVTHEDFTNDGTPGKGAVAIFRADPGGGPFGAPEIHQTSLPLHGQLQIADVDGDGFADLVVVSDDSLIFTDMTSATSGGDESPPGRKIHVFWNDAGSFDFDAPTTLPDLPVPSGGFALMNADGDREKEIVVGTFEGIALYNLDPDSRTFEKTGFLAGLPGGALPVAGDIDGDGVDDLAIDDMTGHSCSVFLGKPVRR